MSYRIHLNLIKKNRFETYYKKYYRDSANDDCPWYLPDVAYESIELCDDLKLDQFKELKLQGDHEYPPYVLNKKDMKIVVDFYQEHLMNIAKSNLNKAEKLREEYSKDGSDKDCILGEIFSLLYSYDNINRHIKWHFEKLIGQDIMLGNSDYFLLQYFYLVKLYENYDSKKDVLIITHG